MYTLVSDPHLGLTRKSGITPAKLKHFRRLQFSVFKGVVNSATGTLIVLGDLNEEHTVPYDVLQETFTLFHNWLTANRDAKLILVAGNHDLSKDNRLSSLEFLHWALHWHWPTRVHLVTEPTVRETGDFAIIPHVANQTIFDKAVSELAGTVDTILTHCNIDNVFAAEKEHSLNLSLEQAALFSHVITGHEHNKQSLDGIDILGAPLPVTISECHVAKGYHTWEGPGNELEFHETWNPSDYAEIDWRSLADTADTLTTFIRVTGEAARDEAALALQEFEKFQARSNALYIVSKITVEKLELIPDSGQGVDLVDALELFFNMLAPEYQDKLKTLESWSNRA